MVHFFSAILDTPYIGSVKKSMESHSADDVMCERLLMCQQKQRIREQELEPEMLTNRYGGTPGLFL